jgi:RNA polymerase-binding transcription factor DksA
MHGPKLSPHECGEYRKRLLELNSRLTGVVKGLDSQVRLPAVEEGAAHDEQADPGDAAAQESQREVVRATLASEGRILTEVHAAIARLDGQSFGLCERCGKVTGKAPLNALPYARCCANCCRTELAQHV